MIKGVLALSLSVLAAVSGLKKDIVEKP